jgi:hypothetical protein
MKKVLKEIAYYVWIVISLLIGGYIACSVSEKYYIQVIFSILIAIALCILPFIVKAFFDPEAKTASDLRMTITRFHLYQRLYDEYQDFLREHDANSKEAYDKFKELFKQVPNPNEWRRYSKYREEKDNPLKAYYEQYKRTTNVLPKRNEKP